jgi:hypothetical protein
MTATQRRPSDTLPRLWIPSRRRHHAILTAIMTLCIPQSGANNQPQPRHKSGRSPLPERSIR